PKPAIREVAVGAIRVALTITSQRETKETQQPQWYNHCLREISLGFDDPKEKALPKDDRIHGSLLVLNELLRCSNNEWERLNKELRHLTHYHIYTPLKKERGSSVVKRLRGQVTAVSPTSPHLRDLLTTLPSQDGPMETSFPENIHESRHCKELLLSQYDHICNLVLSQKNSRSLYIQNSLLQILPRLAALDKERFHRNYLVNSMNYLLTSIKMRDKDRPGSFVCL
ncbi:UNVERIFIED_CONTAM: hypothetical protein GTU68_051306, partial [Idotea baltica]|nr:hypothetical protein [Idotea baltica]